MTQMCGDFLFDIDRPHTRFSAAGSDGLTMRSGGRRREKRQGTKSRGSGAAAVQRALWGFGCGVGLEKFAPAGACVPARGPVTMGERAACAVRGQIVGWIAGGRESPT